jgi:hypothetical protein
VAGPADTEPSLVRRAAREGLADGLSRHLPGTVGIVLKGGAVCALGTFLQVGLGLDVAPTVASSALTGAGLFALVRVRASARDSGNDP